MLKLANNFYIFVNVVSFCFQAQIAEFYATNMKNDALGRVAHMHLALCDILDDGACDPLSIDLAKSQSVAVDFPKTGIIPTVPLKAKTKVKEEGYPDFMEKASGKSYVSDKLLGKLYRRVTSLIFEDSDVTMEDVAVPHPDPHLVVEGHQKYLAEARTICKQYSYDMVSRRNDLGSVS